MTAAEVYAWVLTVLGGLLMLTGLVNLLFPIKVSAASHGDPDPWLNLPNSKPPAKPQTEPPACEA